MRTLRRAGSSSHNELGSLAPRLGSDLPSAVDRRALTPSGRSMTPAVLAAELARSLYQGGNGKRYVAKVRLVVCGLGWEEYRFLGQGGCMFWRQWGSPEGSHGPICIWKGGSSVWIWREQALGRGRAGAECRGCCRCLGRLEKSWGCWGVEGQGLSLLVSPCLGYQWCHTHSLVLPD